jgi:hypothetical protein
MHVVAQDLDLKACHMAYVQFSLLHIPAVVVHGNTLACEERSRWNTPAHVMGGWDWKLRRPEPMRDVPETNFGDMTKPAHTLPMAPPAQWEQAGLFA